MVAVVSRLYLLHNDRSCVPGVHKLFKIITSQWQIVAFLMFLYRNWSILLHHRRRRVRCKLLWYHDIYSAEQECKTNMVLETFSINFHRIHVFLLWWHSKRICTGRFTSWVCFLYLIHHFYSKGEAQYKHFDWGDVLVRIISPWYFLCSFLHRV